MDLKKKTNIMNWKIQYKEHKEKKSNIMWQYQNQDYREQSFFY